MILLHEIFVQELVLLGDGFLPLGDFEGFAGGKVFLEGIDHVHLTIICLLDDLDGVPFANVDYFFTVVQVVVFEFEEVHQMVGFRL